MQESAPDAQEVALKVSEIAHRLTEQVETLWPSPVRALDPSTQPNDAFGRRAGRAPITSWREAGALAERILATYLRKASAEGLDLDGWATVAAHTPAPPHPDAMLGLRLFKDSSSSLITHVVWYDAGSTGGCSVCNVTPSGTFTVTSGSWTPPLGKVGYDISQGT